MLDGGVISTASSARQSSQSDRSNHCIDQDFRRKTALRELFKIIKLGVARSELQDGQRRAGPLGFDDPRFAPRPLRIVR